MNHRVIQNCHSKQSFYKCTIKPTDHHKMNRDMNTLSLTRPWFWKTTFKGQDLVPILHIIVPNVSESKKRLLWRPQIWKMTLGACGGDVLYKCFNKLVFIQSRCSYGNNLRIAKMASKGGKLCDFSSYSWQWCPLTKQSVSAK